MLENFNRGTIKLKDIESGDPFKMELTLNDFLTAKEVTGTPQISFVRNHIRAGYRGYKSVEVTAIIDGEPKPQHPVFNKQHQLMEIIDQDPGIYQLTKFELFIHYLDNPEHDVKVSLGRYSLMCYNWIPRDANLLDSMIHPMLDLVDQIINSNWIIIEKYQLNSFYKFSILKAILIGIAKNPNLTSQIENMLTALSSEISEIKDNKYLQEKCMLLCMAICETIHTSTQQYEIYKCISTPMRTKLIEYFLGENKPDIVAQLIHFSNPIKIEDIPNDERWSL